MVAFSVINDSDGTEERTLPRFHLLFTQPKILQNSRRRLQLRLRVIAVVHYPSRDATKVMLRRLNYKRS